MRNRGRAVGEGREGFPSKALLQTDGWDCKGHDETAKMKWGRGEETAVYT